MSKRRGRNRGSVFYDQTKGRWIGQLPGGTDPDTGKRVRGRKVSATTKTAAENLLDDLRAEVRKTGVQPSASATVAWAAEDFRRHWPASVKSPISKQVNGNHVQRIIDGIGPVKLEKLTVGQVETFLARLAADGYSTSVITRTRSILRQVIRRAQRDGLVGRNVAELADCPAGTRRKSRAMTVDQARALLAEAGKSGPWLRAFVTSGLMLGMRPGELLGLRWSDVTEAGVINVRQSLKRTGGVLSGAELKTESSRRALSAAALVQSALAALRKQQAADRLRLGGHYGDSGLVFADSAGWPRNPQTVRREFKNLCSAAGIGPAWQLREMRHSYVSILSDSGVDIEAIAASAGHINSNVTRTVYRHQIAPAITQAAAAMNDVFGVTG